MISPAKLEHEAGSKQNHRYENLKFYINLTSSHFTPPLPVDVNMHT
jgi:hypothetical protein